MRLPPAGRPTSTWSAWAPQRLAPTDRPGYRWLLNRNLTTGELASYRCYASGPTPLMTW
ncbi:hypothetical protein [Nonomuraea rhizosphaerae]|uniref:hypothetical protein n=1 Tax=Nonomuraea rhizosphaerae TaxID=2665663 RepID=UPI001C5D69E8|nr:hypothetical protein [Nonomuraea rhizosphaerae]